MSVNFIEEQKRQERLDSWYEQDGRHDQNHPLHARYTGLADKYLNDNQGDSNEG